MTHPIYTFNTISNDLFFVIVDYLSRIDIVRIRMTNKYNKQRISKYVGSINKNNLGFPHWFGHRNNNKYKSFFVQINDFLQSTTNDLNDVFHRKLEFKIISSHYKKFETNKEKILSIIENFTNGQFDDFGRYLSSMNVNAKDITINIIFEKGRYFDDKHKEIDKMVKYFCSKDISNKLKQILSTNFYIRNIEKMECRLVSSHTFDWKHIADNSNVNFIKPTKIKLFNNKNNNNSYDAYGYLKEFDIMIAGFDKKKFYKINFDKNNNIKSVKLIGSYNNHIEEHSRDYDYIFDDKRIFIGNNDGLYISNEFDNKKDIKQLSIMKYITFEGITSENSNDYCFLTFIPSKYVNDKIYFLLIDESESLKLVFFELNQKKFEIKQIGIFDGFQDKIDFDEVVFYEDRLFIFGIEPDQETDYQKSLIYTYKWFVKHNKMNIELLNEMNILKHGPTEIWDKYEFGAPRVLNNGKGLILVIAEFNAMGDETLKAYLYRVKHDKSGLFRCDSIDIKLYRCHSRYMDIDLYEMMSDTICLIFVNEEILVLDLENDKIRLAKRHCLEMRSEFAEHHGFYRSLRMRNNIWYCGQETAGECMQFN